MCPKLAQQLGSDALCVYDIEYSRGDEMSQPQHLGPSLSRQTKHFRHDRSQAERMPTEFAFPVTA